MGSWNPPTWSPPAWGPTGWSPADLRDGPAHGRLVSRVTRDGPDPARATATRNGPDPQRGFRLPDVQPLPQ